jgi:succinoglycan biosynthesis transport protein ExoP
MKISKNTYQLNPREIVTIIWKRKFLLIVPAVLVTLAAYFGSKFMTPVYRSSVTISIGNPVMLSSELKRMTGYSNDFMGTGQSYSGETRRIERALQNEITSTPFLSQLVNDLGLDKNPRLDASARALQAEHPDMTIEEIKMNSIINSLKNRIKIEFVGNNQVMISVVSSDPRNAKDLTESLGRIFMNEKKEQVVRSVYSSLDFSYKQLEKYEEDLQEKIDQKTNLEEQTMRLKMDNPAQTEENRRTLDSEIKQTNLRIEDLKDREKEILVELASFPSDRLKINETQSLTDESQELKDLYNSIADMLQVEKWNSPTMVKLNNKAVELENKIQNEINSIVNRDFSDLSEDERSSIQELFFTRNIMDALYSKKNYLSLSLSNLENRTALLPEYQARLEQITREVNAARDLRDQFKRQLEGFQISQAVLGQARVDLIEPARIPMSPIWPDRRKIILLGFMLGLILGGGTILLVELFDNTIKKVETIEDDFGLRVMGNIPKINGLKKIFPSGT